ncbi:hypothetical protein BJX64DRAFT_137942 [Aspergillus heterothallicus]
MQRVGRKRQVTTCVPCRMSKQKCNRQYPCNHCTKRRKIEDCVYGPPVTCLSPAQPVVAVKNKPLGTQEVLGAVVDAGPMIGAELCSQGHHSGLAKSFGYFEDSNSNTMALLRNLDWTDGGDTTMSEEVHAPDVLEAIKQDIDRMPEHQVLNFLVQYFVSELNWIKQLVHAPSFLARYQRWRDKDNTIPVEDAEFAVLILRVCSYTANFLPSTSYPSDDISGLSFSDIRNTCNKIGDSLLKSCLSLDWKGSIIRVQHIIFSALVSSCEGRTDKFWEGISSACRAAQQAGLHVIIPSTGWHGAHEFEKEMGRRTICNLYLLDSHLSRQLDRVPFLPDDLVTDMLPRLHLTPHPENIENQVTTLELFTERLMQVNLGKFWRKVIPKRTSPYNPTQAEERYEKFGSEYLPTLSPALSLSPDTQWDKQLARLPMQRQLLYISIFDSICWNFKPLLLLTPSQIAALPRYKRVLLQSQKLKLVCAAVKELDAIAALHVMFGGSHTRFAALIFNSFEASVLLLTLCLQPDFPFDQESGADPDNILNLKPTRRKVLQTVQIALARLHMLAEVSEMAAAGARVVSRLFAKVVSTTNLTTSSGSADPTILNIHGPTLPDRNLSWPQPFSGTLGFEGETGRWEIGDSSMRDLLATVAPGDAYFEPAIELQQWGSSLDWS